MWDADEDFQESVPNTLMSSEGTEVTVIEVDPVTSDPDTLMSSEGTEVTVIEVDPVTSDPGSFIRRHLNPQLAAARRVRGDVRATNMGSELMSRFPTLATQHARSRSINRQPQDRRRNASAKIQITALDDPGITTTNNLKMSALLSKNLGRREDTTLQMPLSTTLSQLHQKVRELFPPLSLTDFNILLGRRPCQLVEVVVNTIEEIKSQAPRGLLRLWVRPTVLVMPPTPTHTDSTEQESQLHTNNTVTIPPPADTNITIPIPPPADTNITIPIPPPADTNITIPIPPPADTNITIPIPPPADTNTTIPIPPPADTNTTIPIPPPADTNTTIPIPPPADTNTTIPRPPPADTNTTIPIPPPLHNNISIPIQPPADTNNSEGTEAFDDSLHLEFETSVEDDIVYGVEQMKMRVQGVAQPIVVKRETLLEDLLDLYRDIMDVTKPVYVTYLGEEGQDMGGVTKDIFSHFWDSIFKMYFKGESVCVPFLPKNRRQEAREVFPVIGKVIEHNIGLFGCFPLRLCRCSVMVLADPDQEADEDMLLDDFLRFLPESDRNLLEHALAQTSWQVVVRRQLELFFTLHNMTVLPTSENLSRCLLNLAQVELLDKPMAYLRLMRKGLTKFAISTFFERLNADSLRRFLSAFQPGKDKLVSLLLDLSDSSVFNPQQEVVLYYIIALVRDFSGGQLRHFLRWVTGTETMPESLSIIFNSVYGAARRPVAHTCGNVLELSQEYDSYQDFKEEMFTYIFSEEAFRFTML